jgi:uncharacterized membrane protein YgdD (TMEM256/DUF423 family)
MSSTLWTRRLWMRLGTVNALCALVAALVAFRLDEPAATMMRLGAGFQFTHAIATFACAAFMNSGAAQARHAPAPFLAGSALFAGALYARALAIWDGGDLPLGLGGALMAAGWGVLFVASGAIDPDR